MRSQTHRAIALHIMHFRREATLRINQDLAELGWSAPAYIVLFRLASDEDGANQRDLASDAGLDASAVSRLIARLVDEQLVVASVMESDRRQRLIKLTKRGRRLERALAKIVDAIISQMMSPLETEEQELFLSLLERTTSALK